MSVILSDFVTKLCDRITTSIHMKDLNHVILVSFLHSWTAMTKLCLDICLLRVGIDFFARKGKSKTHTNFRLHKTAAVITTD